MSDRSKDECTDHAATRVIMRCRRCHSQNVMRDAWAVWNAATQEWELGPIFDHSACNDCGAEECIEEITPDGTPVPPDASVQQFVESIERARAALAADDRSRDASGRNDGLSQDARGRLMIRSTDLIERLRRERPDTMAEIARIREAQRERGWKLIRLDVEAFALAEAEAGGV